MFKWLRNKLRSWLGVEKLEEDLADHKKIVDILNRTNDELIVDISKLEKELNFFKSITEVGVDVHTRSNSWAVVCIAGKNEYVKFVDLQQKDARHVLQFLQGFEESHRLIDSPMGSMGMFKW